MILFISGLLLGLLLGLLYCRRAARIAVSNYEFNLKAHRTFTERNEADRTAIYQSIQAGFISQQVRAYLYAELPLTNDKIDGVSSGVMDIILSYKPKWGRR